MSEWKNLGFVYKRSPVSGLEGWHSHTMAPSAIQIEKDRIRVYLGGWDIKGVSRIWWVDVSAYNPLEVLEVARTPALDIGRDGTFDENGVFPAHASIIEGEVRLYYTGFQLGHKIRHYNFGGLAKSYDGANFVRHSEAPILDRSDEGLFVRAGQSAIPHLNKIASVYSAGSSWVSTGGKLRPCYDVYYQDSLDGINLNDQGRCIIKHNPLVEHGLGRPQLIELDGCRYIFYTRRILGMKYFFGYAREDLISQSWIRCDDRIDFAHNESGFDSQMIYFPSVIKVKETGKVYVFYSGNDFGGSGMGVVEWVPRNGD